MGPAEYRRTSYGASQAMAPDWEHWWAQLEKAMSPVRNWLIGEFAPRVGDTVLELSA
jgi:hypothetical protein